MIGTYFIHFYMPTVSLRAVNVYNRIPNFNDLNPLNQMSTTVCKTPTSQSSTLVKCSMDPVRLYMQIYPEARIDKRQRIFQTGKRRLFRAHCGSPIRKWNELHKSRRILCPKCTERSRGRFLTPYLTVRRALCAIVCMYIRTFLDVINKACPFKRSIPSSACCSSHRSSVLVA